MSHALVLGGGGFIGGHLVRRLTGEGYLVTAVDTHLPEFSVSPAWRFLIGDLRDQKFCSGVFDRPYERVYQLAADMGGAGYIFTGTHDAAIMANSAQINLNVLRDAVKIPPGILFYASSACIYPPPHQYTDAIYEESTAYPAQPDSEYGWEKLFSERLYMAHARNAGLNVRIARLHNVYGPESAWTGGKEKAIAALCRKVITAAEGAEIEVWGDGQQTRSFLYIDECLDGLERLLLSDSTEPINIGSAEMVTIQQLAEMIIDISGRRLGIRNIDGPKGVDIRTSHNERIRRELKWSPSYPLRAGLEKTYTWIRQQIDVKQSGGDE
ncbi:MAG: NAD-dependent epimerase/dehydratase family protein [Bacteroidetes bacterium]|nr:NAD-dependent epimerase/dehydratase family protein [Bacteroidota bacterium]